MNTEAQKILELLKQGKAPSIADLKQDGYSNEAIETVGRLPNVKSIDLINLKDPKHLGSTITRLYLDDQNLETKS